jgi:hypothetical protein
MDEKKMKHTGVESFHLSKWFLDLVDTTGTVMIFYAARITWHGLSASYTSCLQYSPGSGISLKSRFSDVQMPQIDANAITWNDSKFGISGKWISSAKKVEARIFDSDEGFLDWKCFQPASAVQLSINGNTMKGSGYAEQLILTAFPWKIPMDELRWGRFGSDENSMVWIEIKADEKRQWLWLNGEKIENCIIEDEQIRVPDKKLVLNLDRSVILESEKKIYTVVAKLIRYIPGFNKIIPRNFLMADETKWLSSAKLQANHKILSRGMAIHELVNFKAY